MRYACQKVEGRKKLRVLIAGDIAGPFPATAVENKFIMVTNYRQYVRKWVEVYAIQNQEEVKVGIRNHHGICRLWIYLSKIRAAALHPQS